MGAWWVVNCYWHFLRDGRRSRARSWYRAFWPVQLIEPCLKSFGLLIALYIELYGHHDHFR